VSLGLPPGWGLDHFAPEVQRYRDKGVTFRSDGLISLDARSNDPDSPTGYTSGAFTSGWLPTQQKIHRGDYVQAAMKLPGGSGMWPALWLLDVPTPDANRTHEIDIMEAVGREPGIVYHTIHFNGQQKQVSTRLDYTQWHTYGVYLGADATYFYVDGRMVGTTDAAPASIEYGVKANLALGGNWAGNPDPAAFPAQVLMTPVRVWSPA
jgi:beta-glucanase (GH16 family)